MQMAGQQLPPLSQLMGSQGPLLETYWAQLDKKKTGKVDAANAAVFLKKSNLRESLLHKIWRLSDPNGHGYLDKQGFFTALRLVAACKNGKEPLLSNISLADPLPRLEIAEMSDSPKNKWTIQSEEMTRYKVMFQNLHPVNGKVPGEKAKPMLLASQLAVETLGKIWTLSDIDNDGFLDVDEFAIAMHLTTVCREGEPVPATLPASLVPPSKKLSKSPNPSRSQSPQILSASPVPNPKLAHKTEWVVTPEILAKYKSYFEGIDKDHDGIVSGEEARGLFMASNLPQGILAQIWNLCDLNRNGKLNLEQFSLAMFLIAEKVRGKEVPKELPPNYIPPSCYNRPESSPSPSHSSTNAIPTIPTASTASPSPLLSSISTPPSQPISAAPVALSSVTASISSSSLSSSSAIAPPPAPLPGSGATAAQPQQQLLDFSSIRELDTISNEIDTLRTERSRLQEEIQTKQETVQQRKEELESLQKDAANFTQQRKELEKEKAEAQEQLNQLESKKAKAEKELAELKQMIRNEQEEIEKLKVQLSEQETHQKSQGEELEQMRKQLEQLRKEEIEYKEKVEVSKKELEKLQKTSRSTQNEITQVRQRMDILREEHQKYTQALGNGSGGSSVGGSVGGTASSTPASSVVNISDVGQLSAELHVAHVSDQDAVSARATAGSSSPVSSISGFSTNSHFEEHTEEASKEDNRSGGGGGGRPEPFGSAAAVDPFSMFTTGTAPPTVDPFGSGGGIFGGKVADSTATSAFDPFGISDSTKDSGVGENPFKNDLFSSVASGSTTADISTTPPVGTDPFSGQDPFSLSELNWGSGSSPFSTDPFGSQQTPTDPFSAASGSDPFGDNPFTAKPANSNAFASDAGWGSTIGKEKK